jgi:hypothetical protein
VEYRRIPQHVDHVATNEPPRLKRKRQPDELNDCGCFCFSSQVPRLPPSAGCRRLWLSVVRSFLLWPPLDGSKGRRDLFRLPGGTGGPRILWRCD